MAQPVVLVTGTSSGIGRSAALHLAQAGCRVVATARQPADVQDLAGLAGVETAPLDVTDEAAVQAAIAGVVDRHGRLDAVVNNAGFGIMLPVEEIPVTAFEELLDVNLLGPHRVARAALPVMRRQGSGRIVNISSAAGHVALPMMGAYSATKFGLRALTTSLHNEVRPFGIHACLVEPGRIATRFGHRSKAERERWLADHAASPYARLHGRWDDVAHNGRGKDADLIARRIVHAVTARRPRLVYRAPFDAKGARLAERLLPDALLAAGVRTYFDRF